MNFGGPTHCKETLPHGSRVIIRFWIHHACKYLVSYPATTVEGTSGSSIPRHFGNANKKRREEKVEICTWKIKFGEEKGDP
jgi:hypothetical protein